MTTITNGNGCSSIRQPILLLHGGADDIPESMYCAKYEGLKKALNCGYKAMKCGGSCLDAVEAAIREMERNENFNTGRGSMLNEHGEVEMDASIMVGEDLSAGSVAAVRDIAHPVSLARMVMEKTPHVQLVGAGANKFAEKQGVPKVPSGSLVTAFAKSELERVRNNKPQMNGGGTVGAVAIDESGRLAAATSTGGLPGKMEGRCGDTPIIGCGTYADDDVGAVSCTGHGESITKMCVAHTIIKQMECGMDPATATRTTIQKMTKRFKATAGAIALSKEGQIGLSFSSEVMPWAYRKGNEIHYGLLHGEHLIELLEN